MLELGWLDPSDLENPDLGGGPAAVRDEHAFVWESQPPMMQAKRCVELLLQGNEAEPRLFSMGRQIHAVELDRNTGREVLTTLNREKLRLKIDELTVWVRMKDSGEGPTRYISAPRMICDHVTALLEPCLPLIDRVVDVAFFDADGNLIVSPGYHETSRTYYAPPVGFAPSIPEQPTSDDVRNAVRQLREPLADFPFRDSNDSGSGDASFAHVVAMLLHPFVRLMIAGPTPAFLIQKPSPGTGASLLADVVSLIAFGLPAKIEVGKTDGDEWRKSITASLLGGASMIVFDNIHAELKDQSIAAAITAETWSDRLLGKSQKVTLPNTALWIFTGNNVTFSSELARRLVMARLDAGLVDPTSERTYKHKDLRKWVKTHRTALVSAILTIVQAWIVAGCPAAKGIPRLASFEDWSTVIGGILSFAEIPGFLRDRDTIKKGITDEADAVQQLVQLMHDVFGLEPARVGKVDWGSRASSIDAPSDVLGPQRPAHLAQLVLDHSDLLSFWWLADKPERWGNRIGRELSDHVDRVFELRTETGTAQFTLHKRKTERGVVYSLKPVKQATAAPEANGSNWQNDLDADDAPSLDEFVHRDPVGDPSPAGDAVNEDKVLH